MPSAEHKPHSWLVEKVRLGIMQGVSMPTHYTKYQQEGLHALRDLEEQLEAAPTEREMRCFARVLDPDRYPLPGEDFTEIINEALHALRRVMPLLNGSGPARTCIADPIPQGCLGVAFEGSGFCAYCYELAYGEAPSPATSSERGVLTGEDAVVASSSASRSGVSSPATKTMICAACRGQGDVHGNICLRCGGSGERAVSVPAKERS